MQGNPSIDDSTVPVLSSLGDPDLPSQVCPRRTRIQLDLMLLALEALDLNASENMLASIQELQLQPVIQNRVTLWKLRNTNPLRRYSRRSRALSLSEAKALVAIACNLARQQTATIRQLLLVQEQLQSQQLSPNHNIQLANYCERFRAHFRSRMNANRSAVAAYQENERLDELALDLLGQVLFCTGTAGIHRFWSSLFDGEVA
ncbi:MAG: DUF3038 domain-containing protein [Cyanobacteria bacterium P01_A01_bin.17]